MGTTSGEDLRTALSQALGGYHSLTADSGSGSSSITDAELANLTEINDGLESHWIAVTSGSAAGDIRILKSSLGYTASTTVLDPNQNFSAAVASGNTYELHKYDPRVLRDMINQALRNLYPRNGRKGLFRRLIDTSLAVDNLLLNSDMEAFASSSFTDWDLQGSPTESAETTIVIQGTQSAKLVSGGSAGQFDQAPHVAADQMTDKVATLEFWTYATTADSARVRIDWDGTASEDSAYHTGADQWELLKAQASVPSTATKVRAILEVAANKTGYFGAGYMAVGDPIVRYTVPTKFRSGPHFVSVQYDEKRPEGPYYPMNGRPYTGRRLRLEGMGILSQPATDSATTEVDEDHVQLIVAEAARLFWLSRGDEDAQTEINKWTGISYELRGEVGMRSLPAETNTWWSLQENIGTRELVLEHR